MRVFITIFVMTIIIGLATDVRGITVPLDCHLINNSELNNSEMKEIWRDVKGYEGFYQVSNLGLVRSVERIVSCGESNRVVKQKILSSGTASNGYLTVNLWKDNVGKTRTVHSLVAESFLEHSPSKFKFVVDHIDADKLNNSALNLRITTNRENTSQKHINTSSRYTGVSWNKNRNKWRAMIQVDGKNEYLGTFINEYDAHLAYQKRLGEV